MTKRVSLGERLCHKVQVVLVSCSSNGVMILQPPWPPKQPWALVCLWVVVMGMKFPISVVGLNFHKTMDFSQSCVEFFLSIRVYLAIILFMDFRSLMMALARNFCFFFSRSCCLALKLLLKSHQMTTFLAQKRSLSEKIIIWVKTLSFWMNKVVIWWLFNDVFRAREWEREEKGTTNSAGSWFYFIQKYFSI